MGKKIKVGIKNPEKLEFELLEDALKGDFINISEVSEISFDDVKKEIEFKKDEIMKNIFEENKGEILFASKEYRELEQTKNKLQHALDDAESKAEAKIKSVEQEINSKNKDELYKLELEINNLTREKDQLTIDYASRAKIIEQKIIADNKDELHQLETKVNDLIKEKEQLKIDLVNEAKLVEQKAISNNKDELHKLETRINDLTREKDQIKLDKDKDIKLAVLGIENEFKEQLRKKDIELDEIKRQHSNQQTKVMGENLEKWILGEAERYINTLPNVSFKKANTNIDGRKPDFIFTVKDDNGAEVTSVTIEAKTESFEGTSKLKNSTHFKKLDEDRIRNKTEYSLLITELEKDIDFTVTTVNDYENMFMSRPTSFVSILLIIYNVAQQKMKISSLDLDLKTKQEIRDEFEELKSEIITKSLKHLATHLESIEKHANTIIDRANDQLEAIRKATKYSSVIESKMETFKIEKIIDKLKE